MHGIVRALYAFQRAFMFIISFEPHHISVSLEPNNNGFSDENQKVK